MGASEGPCKSDTPLVMQVWAKMGSELLREGCSQDATVANPPIGRATDVLVYWAEEGAQILARPLPSIDWKAVVDLTEVTSAWLSFQSDRMRSIMERSNLRLAPLADPLSVDFGAHRWLAHDREEAYSDWLAWVVRELKEPHLVLPLFGIEDDDVAVSKAQNASFCPPDREAWILDGTRRLDLVIRYEGAVLIVVEVKVRDADSAETAKQEDYFKWMETQPEQVRFPILLAIEGRKQEYSKFRFFSWAHLCVLLRRIAPEVCASRSPIVAAMVLAFVGAIEQNLLGYSEPDASDRDGRRLTSSELIDHISRSLEGGSQYESKP